MFKNTFSISLLRSLMSVRFLLTAFILILSAICLRPCMKAISQRYTKQMISLRRPLKEFNVSSLPTFRNGWDFVEQPLSVSDAALGTDKYIIINLSKRDQKDVSVKLFITYYSDPKDKVPHTPEMCYTQSGAVIKETSAITIDSSEFDPKYPQPQGRLLIFDMPKSSSDVVVLYCFFVEGEFRLSRNQTRLVLNRPGNRYTYFSKIEVMSPFLNDKDKAETIERCKTLFYEALSVLLKNYLPEKDQLKGN